MGLFRRIAGFLGLSREDEEEGEDAGRPKSEGSGGADDGAGRNGADPSAGTAARGFGVQVPVAVERPNLSSVLVPCDPGEGGVQVNFFRPFFSNPVDILTKKGRAFFRAFFSLFDL